MKLKIKIPKGWRKLKSNEIIKRGDCYWSFNRLAWGKTCEYGKLTVKQAIKFWDGITDCYIRKIKSK